MSRMLRARILAATDILASVKEEERLDVSSLQCNAILDLVGNGKLAGELAAEICGLIEPIKFHPTYRKLILDRLKTLSTPTVARRGSQDYRNAINLVTEAQWNVWSSAESTFVDVSAQIIDHLLKLNCINACEHTKKMWTTVAVILAEGSRNAMQLTERQMTQYKQQFGSKYNQKRLRFKRDKVGETLVYNEECWTTAQQFKEASPDHYRAIYESIGEPSRPPSQLTQALGLDATYGCRSNRATSKASTPCNMLAIPEHVQQSPVQQLVPFMQQMQEMQQKQFEFMVDKFRAEDRGRHGIDIKYLNDDLHKRLGVEQPSAAVRNESVVVHSLGGAPLAPVAALPAPPTPATPLQAALPAAPAPATPVAAAAATDAPAPASPAPAAPTSDTRAPAASAVAPAPAASDAAARSATGPAAKAPASLILLRALEEREAHKKAEQANNKRLRLNAKTVDPAGADAATPAEPKKSKGKGKGKRTKTAKSELKPAPAVAAAGKGKLVRFSQPSYSTEWSRNQFMARTGLRGPGQSVRFAWGAGAEHPNMAKAEIAVKNWVQVLRG